jgi:hypothetical protein
MKVSPTDSLWHVQANSLKILDAGTEVLDDYDVLKFIRDKRAQIKAEKEQSKEEGRPNTHRPANFMKSLQKVLYYTDVAPTSLTNPHSA